MTKKQRIEHKIGNQVRKLRIQQLNMSLYLGGTCQDGRFTNLPVLQRLRASITPAPHKLS